MSVAIIGSGGKWGKLLKKKLPPYAEVDYACDIKYRKKQESASDYPGAKISRNYRDISDLVEVAIVATYPRFHAEIAGYFVGKDVHVLDVKPAALKNQDLHRLVERGKSHKVKIAVDLQEVYTHGLISDELKGRNVRSIQDIREIRLPHLDRRLLGCNIQEDSPQIHFMSLVEDLDRIRPDSVYNRLLSDERIQTEFETYNGIKCSVDAAWIDKPIDELRREIIFGFDDGPSLTVRNISSGGTYGLNFSYGGQDQKFVPTGDKLDRVVKDFFKSIRSGEECPTSLYNEKVQKAHEIVFRSIKLSE